MLNVIWKIQGLWSKEWLIKFISLCLAGMLWYFVGGEDVVEKTVMIPVEVINKPADLVISNKYKKDVEVTVRGRRSQILEMGKDQVVFQIDLSKATPGTKVESIENESIPVSRGIEVQQVQPSSIILSLDKLIKKEFQINPVTTGDVTPGYILEALRLDPETITITGPQTVLSQVEVLKTVPINISGLFESVQLQIPLELDATLVDLIGETSITADISINFDTVEKTISNVPVSVLSDGLLQEVKPAKVEVSLRIPKMIIKKKMDFGSLFTVTAVSEEGRDDLKVQVIPSSELTVPLEIVSIVPERVKLANPPPVADNIEVQEEEPNSTTDPEKE